jgi:hypothetical protein
MRIRLTSPTDCNDCLRRSGLGRVGVTLCPGKYDPHAISGAWERDLALDLDAIRNWGASAIVTCVSARGLDHDRRGGPIIPFSEINGLKGSRRRRRGSIFDQHSQRERPMPFRGTTLAPYGISEVKSATTASNASQPERPLTSLTFPRYSERRKRPSDYAV